MVTVARGDVVLCDLNPVIGTEQANIAEGYGRESRGEYVQFLRIAQGSLKELETHFLLAKRVQLMTPEAAIAPLKQCDLVGKILRALILSLKSN